MSLAHQEGLRRIRPARSVERFFGTSPEQKKFSFDGEKELTPERLQAIISALERYKNNGKGQHFLRMGASLQTLLPDNRFPAHLFDESALPLVGAYFDEPEETNPYDTYAVLRGLHNFYPGELASYAQQQERWMRAVEDMIQSTLKHVPLRKDRVVTMYKCLFEQQLLAPEKQSEFSVDEETFALFLKELNTLYEHFRNGRPQDIPNPGSVIACFATASVVERNSGRKSRLPLDDSFAAMGKSFLEDCERQQMWDLFVPALENLAILSADEVRIPSPGRIELARSFIPPTTKLPQIREY